MSDRLGRWLERAIVMVNMRRFLGAQAGVVRSTGLEVAAHVPDCAVLKENDEGKLYWSYVQMTFDIKLEM